AAGNEDPTPAVFAWTIDLTAPSVTITGHPNDPTSGTSAVFTFTADEPATFRCAIDAGSLVPCASGQTYGDLTNGSHNFTVVADDTAGNTSTAVGFAWRVDTIPPMVTISSAPQSPTKSTAATFSFTSSEPGTFLCKLDGKSYSACVSGLTE